jgi:hypothetical protein
MRNTLQNAALLILKAGGRSNNHWPSEGKISPQIFSCVKKYVILCGVIVIVLAIGPKFRGFKPGRER